MCLLSWLFLLVESAWFHILSMGVYFDTFSSLLPHFHWSTVSHVRLGRLPRRNCLQCYLLFLFKVYTYIASHWHALNVNRAWILKWKEEGDLQQRKRIYSSYSHDNHLTNKWQKFYSLQVKNKKVWFFGWEMFQLIASLRILYVAEHIDFQ